MMVLAHWLKARPISDRFLVRPLLMQSRSSQKPRFLEKARHYNLKVIKNAFSEMFTKLDPNIIAKKHNL